MTVMAARSRWLKQSIVTFTTWNFVSSEVLVMAPLSYQVEKITLGITRQSTLYTDVPRGKMPRRSGGLEKSKFFIEREQTLSTP